MSRPRTLIITRTLVLTRGPLLTPVMIEGLKLGLIGALTIAVIDSVTTRLPAFNGCQAGRAMARIGLATAGAWGADRLGAPALVAPGIMAGAVLVTGLDVGTSLIGRRSIEPPPGPVGAPWPPQSGYSV